jgi:hypothetical protein
MTDHPVDFSPLDPRRDPDRIDTLIRHVVAQGLPRPVTGLPLGLYRLFKPAFTLSLATILAFCVLFALEGRLPHAPGPTLADPSATAFAFCTWAAGENPGDGDDDAWQALEMLRR